MTLRVFPKKREPGYDPGHLPGVTQSWERGSTAAVSSTLKAGRKFPLYKKAPKTHKKNEGAGKGGRKELSEEQQL